MADVVLGPYRSTVDGLNQNSLTYSCHPLAHAPVHAGGGDAGSLEAAGSWTGAPKHLLARVKRGHLSRSHGKRAFRPRGPCIRQAAVAEHAMTSAFARGSPFVANPREEMGRAVSAAGCVWGISFERDRCS